MYYGACCIILVVLLRRMIGAFDLKYVLWMAVRTLAATAIATVLAYFISVWLPVGEGMLGGFIRLVVAGGVGLVVAFALCALFRIPEMRLVLGLIEKVAGRFARK